MNISIDEFGKLSDGRPVALLTITNRNGCRVRLTNYGAIVAGIEVPDADDVMGDVTLGFDTLAEYEKGNVAYFGVIAGRFANRIAGGRFTLDGREYQLACNDSGVNHLHGGNEGFDKKLWDYDLPDGTGGRKVRFEYTSPDGEENYPGTLTVGVEYEWTDDNELVISYEARTDKPTIVNLTNHTYFNLSAGESDTILDHEVQICAESYTPVDENRIPTGDIESVEGTPLDFREIKQVGHDLDSLPEGYDNNFILLRENDYDARVQDPQTGRMLEMRTTEPGVQFYTGYFIENISGRDGAVYNSYAGLCLEAQHYPDSPNHDNFPSVVLRPGEIYTQRTVYRFSVA